MAFLKATLVAVALLAQAQASYLQNELSFGHNDRISPNLRAVPNWHVMGKPDPPQILSNKLVLTPPAPGNQRGAVWAEKPLLHSVWMADVDFRATGPERGGGNLQIWYTGSDGQSEIGTASIYTVGKFDGLVLVVDQYAGSGGYIRGFLNDGSTEYKSHHSVDSLAFGHCEYSYRNLGRPSRITLKQTADKFEVTVDNRLCFDSTKIKLPIGSKFGLSAASAENPDSFEIFKFVLTTESHTPDVNDPNLHQYGTGGSSGQQSPMGNSKGTRGARGLQEAKLQQMAADGDIPSFKDLVDPPDAPAESFKSSDAQFADLHNRIQAMMKHIAALNRDVQKFGVDETTRLEIILAAAERLSKRLDALENFEKKLDAIQADLRQTKSDVHNVLDRNFAGLKNEVRDSHGKVLGHIGENRTGIWGFLFVVFLSQGVLIGAYVWIKRRKANGPKKYL